MTLAFLGLMACAPYDTGVLSVHISLTGAVAGGQVNADVLDDFGLLDATGLDEPAEGLVYVPVLTWSEHPRSGLPEATGGHGGGDDHHAEAPSLSSTAMEPLSDLGDGAWAFAFTSADSPNGLGALRACMVMLAEEDGDPMEGEMVLSGEVDFEAAVGGAEEEESGHSHGV